MGSLSPLALVACGAAMISFAPVFVKWIQAVGVVGPTAMGALRCLLGSAVLFALALARGAPLRPTGRTFAVVIAGGVAFSIDLFVWHRSIVLVGAGMATLLGNTQVFWTTSMGRVAFGETLSNRFLLAVPIAFAGLALLTGVGSDIAWSPVYVRGVALGLATGVAYACYIIIVQRTSSARIARRGTDDPLDPLTRSMLVLAWVTLVAGITMSITTFVEGQRLLPDLRSLALLIGLALVAQVIGWLVIASGLQRAGASRAALVLLLQPTLAAVWGALLFDEVFTALQTSGAALTLGAVYLGSSRGT